MSKPRGKKGPTPPTVPVDAQRVEALLRKLRQGQNVAADEAELLANIVESWAHLSERARRFDLTLADLRRMLGVLGRPPGGGGKGGTGGGSTGGAGGGGPTGSSGPLPGLPGSSLSPGADVGRADAGGADSGSTDADGATADGTDADGATADGADSDANPERSSAQTPHGRRGSKAFGALPTVRHMHSDLGSGCNCPACHRGKLYRFLPRTFVSISGQAPFVGCRHEVERLQCNFCKHIFEAALSDDLQADGVGEGRLYSHSARSQVTLLKFLGVMPWHRQQTLQAAVGVAVPDASMSDMCEAVAGIASPVVKRLHELAADAPLLYGDDTSAAIFGLDSITKSNRRSGADVERTACHTTTVIARLLDGRHVALFRVGIQHTGELLDLVLGKRTAGLPPPLVMSDASSSNEVTVCAVRACGCNAHAIRRFKDLAERYPEEVAPILESYRAIFANDAETLGRGMNDAERLKYHRAHSRPLFKQMCREAHRLLDEHIVEPNNELGKALDYLLNHERRLGAFFRLPGAPMTNNLSERELRLPVRLRDAAPLFRSTVGAAVAAKLWTLLVTALMSGTNLFDYLNALQRHADDVRRRPGAWLPWTFRADETADHTQTTAPSFGVASPGIG